MHSGQSGSSTGGGCKAQPQVLCSYTTVPVRMLLLLLLLLTMCSVCVSGMQTSQYISSSQAGVLSGSVHSAQFMQQQAYQQASVLLGHELGGRRRSCFRSGSASCRH